MKVEIMCRMSTISNLGVTLKQTYFDKIPRNQITNSKYIQSNFYWNWKYENTNTEGDGDGVKPKTNKIIN